MYVYIIQSINFSSNYYVGKSHNLKQRLIYHNNGLNTSTVKYKPWKIVWFCWFEEDSSANEFEKYLKSGSGTAFRHKRLTRSSQ
jgi:putative endonuclease